MAKAIGTVSPHAGTNSHSFVRFTNSIGKGLVPVADESWALSASDAARCQKVQRASVEILERCGYPLPASELHKRLRGQTDLGFSEDDKFVGACIRSSPKVSVVGEWYGLVSWGKSKYVWALAALYKLGRPSHFTRITHELRVLAPQVGAISEHSVHEMLSRSRLVAVSYTHLTLPTKRIV